MLIDAIKNILKVIGSKESMTLVWPSFATKELHDLVNALNLVARVINVSHVLPSGGADARVAGICGQFGSGSKRFISWFADPWCLKAGSPWCRPLHCCFSSAQHLHTDDFSPGVKRELLLLCSSLLPYKNNIKPQYLGGASCYFFLLLLVSGKASDKYIIYIYWFFTCFKIFMYSHQIQELYTL